MNHYDPADDDLITAEDRLFRVGLYELSTMLVLQANGAAEPAPHEENIAVVRYLRKRLAEWRPSCPLSEARDDAMRAYVEAALREWWHHFKVEWQAECKRAWPPVDPPPRYDDVFAEGTAWLDGL